MTSKESKNSWFGQWFNTHYYHLLYGHRDESEAEAFIQALAQELNIPKGAHCMDLACGKGRHAKMLHQLGFETLGLDLAEESIQEAKKLSTQGLRFDVHDMREVYAKGAFDYVFNLFTSFGYFEVQSDNLKTLKAIHQSLKTNGELVIDFMNADKVIRHLVAKDEKCLQGVHFVQRRRLENGIIIKDIEVIDGNETHWFQERVQALTIKDFETLLQASGFEILNTYGDYKLSPFNKESADRLIIHAKKLSP